MGGRSDRWLRSVMPYIVTTKRDRAATYLPSSWKIGEPRVLSRRAVAALDGQAIWNALYGVEIPDREETVEAIAALPKSGGTITLSDGTVIEVEATTWRRLWDDTVLTLSVLDAAEAGNE